VGFSALLKTQCFRLMTALNTIENSVLPSADSSIASNENTIHSTSSTTSTLLIAPSATITNELRCKKRDCFLENYTLMWLDSDANESSGDYCKLNHALNQMSVNPYLFTDADECIDFITSNDNEKISMILSGIYAQYLTPLIHEISQLNALFVFSNNEALPKELQNTWLKFKGTITNVNVICEPLKHLARRHEQNSIPIIFLTSTKDKTVTDLNQLDPSFMYTRILKEILFELDYDENSVKEFMDYIPKADVSTDATLAMIELEYHNHSPIWWYTSGYFFYSVLNRALRTLDTATIIKMGFFVRDLDRQIEQLHREEYGNQNNGDFTLYRGQGMSLEDFQKLNATKGGLLSFNNFLSTSKDKDISFVFAESNAINLDFVGILFEITVDLSVSSTPFASPSSFGYYGTEESQQCQWFKKCPFYLKSAKSMWDFSYIVRYRRSR
jgi:hypothetical protein